MGLLQIMRDNRAAALAERDQRDRERINQAAFARLDEIREAISSVEPGPLKTPGEMVDVYTTEAAKKILADAMAPPEPVRDIRRDAGLLP